jgi:hypothetical protein
MRNRRFPNIYLIVGILQAPMIFKDNLLVNGNFILKKYGSYALADEALYRLDHPDEEIG